jgi:Synergist-CTERM protein sorting domain-containing protein
LESLTFIGSKGTEVLYTFKDGVELEKITNVRKKNGGGGCDAGVSFLTLSLLAPLVLRLRKRS